MSKDWFGRNWSNRAHFLYLLQMDLDFITLQVCLLNMKVVQNGYFMSSIAYAFKLCPPAMQIYWFESVNGLFKVNLEFRISGETWKMKCQFVLETGNWKPGFLKPRFENPDSWLLSKKATINWEKSSKPGFSLLSLVENQRLKISNCWEIS